MRGYRFSVGKMTLGEIAEIQALWLHRRPTIAQLAARYYCHMSVVQKIIRMIDTGVDEDR